METMPPAILIVDDEADVRKVVRSVLEADGYQVAEAADGPAALTLMHSVDGVEVCRQIPHDRTKVLMLTARDDAETRDAAMAAGADRYMTKPFSAVELLDAARELLAPAS